MPTVVNLKLSIIVSTPFVDFCVVFVQTSFPCQCLSKKVMQHTKTIVASRCQPFLEVLGVFPNELGFGKVHLLCQVRLHLLTWVSTCVGCGCTCGELLEACSMRRF